MKDGAAIHPAYAHTPRPASPGIWAPGPAGCDAGIPFSPVGPRMRAPGPVYPPVGPPARRPPASADSQSAKPGVKVSAGYSLSLGVGQAADGEMPGGGPGEQELGSVPGVAFLADRDLADVLRVDLRVSDLQTQALSQGQRGVDLSAGGPGARGRVVEAVGVVRHA